MYRRALAGGGGQTKHSQGPRHTDVSGRRVIPRRRPTRKTRGVIWFAVVVIWLCASTAAALLLGWLVRHSFVKFELYMSEKPRDFGALTKAQQIQCIRITGQFINALIANGLPQSALQYAVAVLLNGASAQCHCSREAAAAAAVALGREIEDMCGTPDMGRN